MFKALCIYNVSFHFLSFWVGDRIVTSKLFCRKHDSVMCPIYECPENFWDSLTTPMSTFPKFLWVFFWFTVRVCVKIEIRGFDRFWDNSGTQEILGSLWLCSRCVFSKIFNGFLFGWTLWMYLQNLKSVALPFPEIIGVAKKFLAVTGYAHTPYEFPKKLPISLPYRLFLHVHSICRNFRLEFWVLVANLQSRERGP